MRRKIKIPDSTKTVWLARPSIWYSVNVEHYYCAQRKSTLVLDTQMSDLSHLSERGREAGVGTGGRGGEDAGALCLSWWRFSHFHRTRTSTRPPHPPPRPPLVPTHPPSSLYVRCIDPDATPTTRSTLNRRILIREDKHR